MRRGLLDYGVLPSRARARARLAEIKRAPGAGRRPRVLGCADWAPPSIPQPCHALIGRKSGDAAGLFMRVR